MNYLGVKGDNLELISGLLLSSFILNYMVIRIKEKELESEKEEGRTNDRERRRMQRKAKVLGDSLLDHDPSVEVGYGLCYFIVNS